ncbi:MAG: hypothetical protein IV090_19845 [Candidatus Sericytochromatia bacterium]|nr:hypothetical protein [Candidatus Sericytochromatia bacterium]
MEKMKIEIKPHPDGTWAVVAHTTSGKVHDFLPTKERAIAFAKEFYGCIKITVVKPIPATTDARCRYYGTTANRCTCDNYRTRNGGSYLDENDRNICKHIHHYRSRQRGAHGAVPAKVSLEAAKVAVQNLYGKEAAAAFAADAARFQHA